jgi:hypothetical protein
LPGCFDFRQVAPLPPARPATHFAPDAVQDGIAGDVAGLAAQFGQIMKSLRIAIRVCFDVLQPRPGCQFLLPLRARGHAGEHGIGGLR